MTSPHARRRNALSPQRPTTNNASSAKAVLEARRRVERYPMEALGWRTLGALLLVQYPDEALASLNKALDLAPDDCVTLDLLAQAENAKGHEKAAFAALERALAINPEFSQGHFRIASMLYQRTQYDRALVHIETANTLTPENIEILSSKGNVLYRLYRFDEALEIFETLTRRHPQNYGFWNNVGNVKRDTGQFHEADKYYRRSIALAKNDAVPFSNRLTTLHYRPDINREEIFEICKEWQTRFATERRADRPTPISVRADRVIRLGIFSDGFRAHPVGWMSTAALENLQNHEIELYLYSTNQAVDHLTQRIQRTSTKWMSVQHLSDDAFADLIREDQIDILMDLCGHNAGNRMQVMVMEPAPILVKWVGGLINTTGVEAIDYLLTDTIETPAGEEAFYTEKLIRMPDDYICFAPPPYSPPVESLPALKNGYITLGCFNNPIKINNVLLTEWSVLMQELVDSRLFLKGHQFANEHVCQQIRDHMAKSGIAAERLIFEGQSKHQALLETYNRIDIALDPWPYSGGLTTCEAMLMGVPVVTLPGPTFAGRHSATHLVNAGMPELVVSSWEEYRERVIELASDLNSLSTIRTHLRDILLQSPVCDGPRFGKHFTTAMRAIWQRYCEGKMPAALTIDRQGEAWFEGESYPMEILHPAIDPKKIEEEFSFSFTGKIVTVDNGAVLVSEHHFAELHKLGAFSTIVFDPASKIETARELQQQGELHHFPHAALGDGHQTTLFACMDPNMSATVEPLPTEQQLPDHSKGTGIIARLPINTQRLDDIQGLENIDWLLLDNLSDSYKILANGKTAVSNALLIQIRVNFASSHYQQPELAQMSALLSDSGFSFYRLNNLHHANHLLESDIPIEQQATQLVWADALYIPNTERMAILSGNQRLKLAFVLHTVYGINDLTQQLINAVSPEMALAYMKDIRKKTLIQQARPALDSVNRKKFEPTTANRKKSAIVKARYNVDVSTEICVGVPIYNEDKYITETLLSLKAQDIDNVHFLIADNHSTDNTLEICCDVIGTDNRFSIIQHETNIGAFKNFRFAFESSASNYFMWLGGHDYISAGYLKNAAHVLKESPQISMVCGQPYAVMNSLVKGVVEEAIYDFSNRIALIRYLQSIELLNNCTILHSMFRREALRDLVWRPTISVDHVLISHLLWRGNLQYMKESNYYRRYFKERTSSQSERISGDKKYLSRNDFYAYYLDDFAKLYTGDNRMKSYLDGKIIGLLEQRFGTQGMLPHDGLLFS